MHPASGCISRCKKRTKLDKTRYFWSKLDILVSEAQKFVVN